MLDIKEKLYLIKEYINTNECIDSRWREMILEYKAMIEAKEKSKSVERYYVYILNCKDGTYYTGYTTDLDRRLSEHNSGSGAKYTRGRGPCKIVYSKAYPTMSDAMKEEYRIKQLSRKEKIHLIEEGN